MPVKRTWHGFTTKQNAPVYQAMLLDRIFPRIESRDIPGFRGVELLRFEHDDEVEFLTVMTFDSIEDVKGFQGADYQRAWVPPEAREVLARFDDVAMHYEVVATRPRP